ncbi:hypothetical protein DK853_00860 [Klebsiella oxytoca]|nr:hypothetical protein DK853_00860 [Klebsiella oxytoca]
MARQSVKLKYTSSFKLPLCWLRLPAPVTDSCQLPGTNNLAASRQHERFCALLFMANGGDIPPFP